MLNSYIIFRVEEGKREKFKQLLAKEGVNMSEFLTKKIDLFIQRKERK